MFQEKEIQGSVVVSVNKSLYKNNIVITTTPTFMTDFLIEKREIWKVNVSHTIYQKDQLWYKVIAHSISTLDFNCLKEMNMIVDKIKTFNKGLTPIETPYWLTSAEKRITQRAESVAIAFVTQKEVSRAIKERLYIAEISVQVEKLYSTASTMQCQKCQGFRHLNNYCCKWAICRLCAELHSIKQHSCHTCKSKSSCNHLEPKCENCHETHQADSKVCEVLLAMKAKAIMTTRQAFTSSLWVIATLKFCKWIWTAVL